jgi:excinuclease ABC subunit C
MMREILSRRFAPGKEDGRPDLIVVDGGIGQLNILTLVLRRLGIDGVATVGLAKSRVAKGMREAVVTRSDERVFLPGRKNPVVLRQNSPPLLLLAQIRDEAHRFAVTYHKNLRSKSALASLLDDVPGIGGKRKAALLRHFGSLKGIFAASPTELAGVPGISGKVAETLWQQLHPAGEAAPESSGKDK